MYGVALGMLSLHLLMYLVCHVLSSHFFVFLANHKNSSFLLSSFYNYRWFIALPLSKLIVCFMCLILFWFKQSDCDSRVSPYLKKELIRIYSKEKSWRERLWRKGIIKSSLMSSRKFPDYVGTEEVFATVHLDLVWNHPVQF